MERIASVAKIAADFAYLGANLIGVPIALFALFELHAGADRLAVAQDLHVDNISHFAAAERVGEVVQILDRLVAELDQNVSRFQSGLRRRRVWLHVGKFDAVFGLAKVGNGTEIWTVAASATG